MGMGFVCIGRKHAHYPLVLENRETVVFCASIAFNGDFLESFRVGGAGVRAKNA